MIGREDNLKSLQGYFASDKNNLTVLYSRKGLGKTTLIKEFLKGKQSVYYNALPLTADEALLRFTECASVKLNTEIKAGSYHDAFLKISEAVQGGFVLVIENFAGIVKVDRTFMPAVEAIVRGRITDKKVMVILTSSSVSWVENSMVSAIGAAAFSINVFMKLKELSYADTVSMFSECDARTALYIYAITGGNPLYMTRWEPDKSIRSNVCGLFLSESGPLFSEATDYIRDEFREISVYGVILSCLSRGLNKLNDIYEYTGFGRDKISVYLSNLIEREIAEKVFSYEEGGRVNTKKGLYRIKDDFICFWYRFIYPHYGLLSDMEPEQFFDRFIGDNLDDFVMEAYIKVASEFLAILSGAGRLPAGSEYKGRWYGKSGDIHIIYENAQHEKTVAQVYVKRAPVDVKDYETLLTACDIAAKEPATVYMFTTGSFSDELSAQQGRKLMLVSIDDL